MATQVTEKTEVVDNADLPKEPGESKLVVHEDGSVGESSAAPPVSMEMLKQMGFITPIATPEHLRAAFAYKQQMYAAVLDERDYLYTVVYTSNNKSQQNVYADFSEAQALAKKFSNLGAVINAKPKKSGVVKLARALGITAKRVKVTGLPVDPSATYSYVEYQAEHEGTGMSEIGVGWCDKTERGGRISTHDVIATADTRAYNRAVLRLSGFGDVSADEIIAGASDGDDLPVEVPQPAKSKESKPLPKLDDPDVLAACRAWAESAAERERFAPPAKQDTRAARELRAQARRGDKRAGTQLGAQGLQWAGTASDGPGYPAVTIEAPPVSVSDILKARSATQEAREPETKTKGEDKGWDLSAQGSAKDDDASDTKPPQSGTDNIPAPQPDSETVTMKQAKNVSGLLKQLFTNKDDMVAWLERECHVNTTPKLRSNQYEAVMSVLGTKVKAKEASSDG